MAALREIIASFFVDMAPAERGLKRGESAVDGFKKSLAGVAGVIAGAFAADKIKDFVTGLIGQADEIGDVAAQLGVSTKALQEWRWAAQQSGIEAGEIGAAFTRLGAQIADSAAGQGNADTFKKLGVRLKDTKGELRSTEDVFADTAAAIGALKNPTERAGAASQIFGKQYAKLLPLFNEGPEGIAKLRQEFTELGGGFSDSFIKDAQAIDDEWNRVALSFKSFAVQTIGPLLPDLQALSKELTKFLAGVRTGDSGFLRDMLTGTRALLYVFNQIRDRPQEFVADFVNAFGEGGRAVLGVIDMLTGGWDNAEKKIAAIMTGLSLPFRVAMEEIRTSARLTVAGVIDDFAGMWNAILLDVQTAITKIGVAVAKVPGLKELGASIVKGGLGLTSSLAPTDAKTKEQEAADERFAAIRETAQNAFDELNTFRGIFATKNVREADTELPITGRRAEPEPEQRRAAKAPDLSAERRAFAEYVAGFAGPGGSEFRQGGWRGFASAADGPPPPALAGSPMYPTSVSAPAPASVTNDHHVDVGGVRVNVNQNISVPEGTTEEQARELGRGASKGVRDAMNTRQLEAALVHTAG